jgi:alanine dehydrogenase
MGALLLTHNDVVELLTVDECIVGVEQAFRLHGEGKVVPPSILGMHVQNGAFHIKAGILGHNRTYFVAKLNANFPCNPTQNGLPMIQGVIAVFEVSDGRLLALIDSIDVTIIRTGAATAIAAKYLACAKAKTATICGCGNQGKISLDALMKVRELKTVYAFDTDELKTERLRAEFASQVKVIPVSKDQLSAVLKKSEIIITCTPSKQPFISREDVSPGTFIAAVGADSEDKQELSPGLLVASKVVVDVLQQCATIGELHHAIAENKLTMAAVHAELGMIIAGKKPGRECENEIIVFDSTGMALQDAAAASIVYEKALARRMGTTFTFDSSSNDAKDKRGKHSRDASALGYWFPFR